MFLACSASARIGFTLDECKAQYGNFDREPWIDGRETFASFKTGDVWVELFDGKVFQIMYTASRGSGGWSKSEALAILKKNTGPTLFNPWKLQSEGNGDYYYTGKDEKHMKLSAYLFMFASYPSERVLNVEIIDEQVSAKFSKYHDERSKREQRKEQNAKH